MSKLDKICPDIQKWPETWMGLEQDLDYGKKILEEIMPFAEYLVESGLTEVTIQKHLSYLWLLGGEIIRNVSMDNEYSIPASTKLRSVIGTDGGPYCRHLKTETKMKSFDSTCRKLHKYLNK